MNLPIPRCPGVATVVIALLTASTVSAGPVRPPQPNAGWLFDDGSGVTAADSFAAHDGDLEGGMGDSNWDPEVPIAYAGNSSLAFDGANDRVAVSEAGIVYTYLHLFDSAMAVFAGDEHFEDRARVLQIQSRWKEAALLYAQARLPGHAAVCFESGGGYQRAAEV